ncbi:uncharacterized protein LOC127256890 [Andrographis paniculata]|uniref:uncharacterized protein LOC127256890 n=1 Tax=Andrographis paniculata TaxID=175694 RepID=UPI0021E8B061|nr:uncharacterized protein LOC127256890 [Andrographis paniculata]
MSGREEAPTKRQSLPAPLNDPTPSPSEPVVSRVSSDSEATASQMGRLPYVASYSFFLNEKPIAPPASASHVVASAAAASFAAASAAAASIAANPNAAASIARDVSGAAVQVAPDVPVAAAPGAAAPRVADPIPEEARREEDPHAAAQPRGLLQEIEEISSSDSETSVNLGPRSAPQRPFAAAEESAIVVPAARFPRPTTLLAPSGTTVRPEGHLDLAPLSAVLIPADIQAIFAQAVNRPFPDLGSDFLYGLLQAVGGLLFQIPSKSAAAPTLHRLMERLAELRNDILLARLLSAEPSQPISDQISLEASLAKTRESLQQAIGRLYELLSTKTQIDESIERKEAQLRTLRQEQSALEGHVADEQCLIERYKKNEADLDQELKIQTRSQFIKRYQATANNRRLSRAEDKWSQIKTALGVLL